MTSWQPRCRLSRVPWNSGDGLIWARLRCGRHPGPDGNVRTTTVELPREQWAVCIRDHHPGYIDWAAFEANQAKLAANRTNAGARPPREGTALCQGIALTQPERSA